MGKLIFFDVDGTLAMPGQPPSPATVAAIRAAKANGHKVFLSTGRLKANVAEEIHAIGFNGGIYSAGGCVVVDEQEILNLAMPAKLVRQVTDILREFYLFFMLENASGTYVGSEDYPLSRLDSKARRLMEQELHVLPHEWVPEYDRTYKIVFHAETKAQAEQLCRKLNRVAKAVYFDRLLPDMAFIPGEVSDPSINKATALDRICRCLNAGPEDCIAFGDSMNDMEILQAAGLGIAMGNAEDRVKELADQVCWRCDEDGVAKALAELRLI